ncbi:hypothetical protein [Micromonospora sp. NPDC093244]|uniref:hypothetical protein n=1 Tax=Micromonospora sp. NPDC093244 TaxID=3155071 RepID=UPI003442D9F7
MPVPANKIELLKLPVTGPVFSNPANPASGITDYSNDYVRVCGTCGAVVAAQHVDVHISWHAATPTTATVTTSIPDRLK